jgi:hypothetical protein
METAKNAKKFGEGSDLDSTVLERLVSRNLERTSCVLARWFLPLRCWHR